MTPDSELLRRFAKTNSQDAFAELVKRHVNLVYSTALRKMNGDEHLAKDVAQTVFADLARKADSLSRHKNLTGWLYTSAHFAAAKIVRGENRRRDREENFMRESEKSDGTGVSPVELDSEADWQKIRPALDDAMHKLKESDRDAILFRYFENRPFGEVGAKLGLNENAARMRVERALEKLRTIFGKRGITTATAFASVISVNAIQIAPANLAATLTTASIAAAGTGTFTLLKIMTVTKLKLGVSALVVAGAVMAFVIQHQTQNKLRAENESLTQQIAQLQTDNENFSNRVAEIGDTKKLSDDQFNELLKLRGEVGVLQRQADEEINAVNQKAHAAEEKLTATLSVQAKFKAQETETISNMKQLGLAERLFAGDNNNVYATNLIQMTNELGPLYTNAELYNIEFVNAGTVNDRYPQMLMFRERLARQASDGTWHRVYGFSDGSVWVATSYDGNFDAYEQQHAIPPPNQ